jgi:peroxiredoxin
MKRIIRAGRAAVASLLASNAVVLQVEDTAPDFTAHSTKGEITLSRRLLQGPVVLPLYYADFTPG